MSVQRRQSRLQERQRAKLLKGVDVFSEFTEIDLNKSNGVPPKCLCAFQNSQYIVTVYCNDSTVKLMIQRKDDSVPTNQFSDFQRIKNELLGKGKMAVQYYPPESDLIDEHNIYWLFHAFN